MKFMSGIQKKINIDLLNDKFHMNDLIKQIKIIIKTPNKKLCYESTAHGFLDLLKYANQNYYQLD